MDGFKLATGEPLPSFGPRQPPALGAAPIAWLASANHGRAVVSGRHWAQSRRRGEAAAVRRDCEFRGFAAEEAVWHAVEGLVERCGGGAKVLL